jgi:DNA-binding HxlR family transcriptional regulator
MVKLGNHQYKLLMAKKINSPNPPTADATPPDMLTSSPPASSTTEPASAADSPIPAAQTAGAHRWTFLTNHAHVLILLSRDSTMVLRQVALRIGITERAVQRIIADLEEDGFIQREKVGRNNHYRILDHQPLRHPIESHRTIGDLIKLVSH